MANYTDLLSQRASEVTKPPLVPAGSYRAQVKRHELIESRQKKTPGVRFFYSLLEPGNDVDAEEAAERAERITKAEPREDYYLTADSTWRLKEYLERVLGIDGGSRSLQEMLADADGKECIIIMKHVPTQDGTDMVSILDRSMPL